MKNYASSLLADLERQLKSIHDRTENPIDYAEKAISTTIKTLEKLKSFFKTHRLSSKQEEIEFFKTIKPAFASKLIYYNEVYNIESTKPEYSNKYLKKHYSYHLNSLHKFNEKNKEFIKYFRTNNTVLDKMYFQRNQLDIRLTVDSAYFLSDHAFATSHDHKVAQLFANEEIRKFLKEKLQTIKYKENKKENKLNWTGSKVALVELMYAINSTKVINHGNTSLNELAKSFEAFFDIELGQFNRIYAEIRNRKTIEKTSFINSLKDNLSSRIKNADEI